MSDIDDELSSPKRLHRQSHQNLQERSQTMPSAEQFDHEYNLNTESGE